MKDYLIADMEDMRRQDFYQTYVKSPSTVLSLLNAQIEEIAEYNPSPKLELEQKLADCLHAILFCLDEFEAAVADTRSVFRGKEPSIAYSAYCTFLSQLNIYRATLCATGATYTRLCDKLTETVERCDTLHGDLIYLFQNSKNHANALTELMQRISVKKEPHSAALHTLSDVSKAIQAFDAKTLPRFLTLAEKHVDARHDGIHADRTTLLLLCAALKKEIKSLFHHHN